MLSLTTAVVDCSPRAFTRRNLAVPWDIRLASLSQSAAPTADCALYGNGPTTLPPLGLLLAAASLKRFCFGLGRDRSPPSSLVRRHSLCRQDLTLPAYYFNNLNLLCLWVEQIVNERAPLRPTHAYRPPEPPIPDALKHTPRF